MDLADFKNEFRLICTDNWGNALDAWFECAGQMYKRGLIIPLNWQYSTGFGNGTEEDSYWFELFEVSKDEDLKVIGNFLFRYCQFLKFKKVDY